MKTLEVLSFIKQYYTSRRGVGHTFTMIYGVRDQDNAIVVAHDHQYADRLKLDLYDRDVISLEDIPEKLVGRGDPLVFDHWALVTLIDRVFIDFNQLREENERLKQELERVKRVLSNDREAA